MRSRSAGDASMGTRSLSCRLTPYAPISPSLRTASSGSSTGRVGRPNGSPPRWPTVQRPKVNLSAGVGTNALVMERESGAYTVLPSRRGRSPHENSGRTVGDGPRAGADTCAWCGRNVARDARHPRGESASGAERVEGPGRPAVRIAESLDQSTTIPIDAITVTGDTVRVSLKVIGATFTGTLNAARTETGRHIHAGRGAAADVHAVDNGDAPGAGGTAATRDRGHVSAGVAARPARARAAHAVCGQRRPHLSRLRAPHHEHERPGSDARQSRGHQHDHARPHAAGQRSEFVADGSAGCDGAPHDCVREAGRRLRLDRRWRMASSHRPRCTIALRWANCRSTPPWSAPARRSPW